MNTSKVYLSELSQFEEKLIVCTGELKNTIGAFCDEFNNLGDAWSGDSADAFKLKLEEKHTELLERADKLKEFYNYLNTYIKEMENLDKSSGI